MDKPFDRGLKALVDQAPELFFRLAGILPLPPGWHFKMLRQETSPPVLMPDFVTMAIGPRGQKIIFHMEFYLDYEDRQPAKMAKYGGSLMSQYDTEVRSVMALVRSAGRSVIPRSGEYKKGKTAITHEFETVKFWEIDAAPILENESMRHLFALVPALQSDWATVRKVAAAVVESGNAEELSRLLLMLSLKYNKEQIDELIGREKMGFGEILWEGSSLLKDMREKAISSGLAEGMAKGLEQGREQGLEQGREQGLERGLEAGRCAEARRLLCVALARRFPGLEDMPEIAAIPGVAQLESLLIDHVFNQTSRASMETAIRKTASGE